MTDGAPARPRRSPRALVSPLLRESSEIDETTRDRLVKTVDGQHAVLIELQIRPGRTPDFAREMFGELFRATFAGSKNRPAAGEPVGSHYLRAMLSRTQIERLVLRDRQGDSAESIVFRVWPDYVIHAHLDRSVSTIKADAAARTYGCSGTGIVWAVIDSGVDGEHPHFAGGTLTDPKVKDLHRDFTGAIAGPNAPVRSAPLTDGYGHGSHVAGIIAGSAPADSELIRIAANDPTISGLPSWSARVLEAGYHLDGVAPTARLVSLKVIDDDGGTLSSVVIDALNYVRQVNSGGRELVIHGVNVSLGCDWVPGEFAAGQSPLCRELNLLVATGVIAVVSAGNSGAAGTVTGSSTDVSGRLSTITDPGNAAGAITVGSTHRYRPHTYGVTFDSSKGPTLDGRLKPDLVAPGERITSVATGAMADGVTPLASSPSDKPGIANYVEDSGTSMAAAHVSGVIASFLSSRTEFVGEPQQVKELFCNSATSLGRHEFFQGAGLIDLMRAMSNV